MSDKEVTIGLSGYVRNPEVVLSQEGPYSIHFTGGISSIGILKKGRY